MHVCFNSFSCVQLYGLCSLPGFSIHGIFQARILEWVARLSSKRASGPRVWTCLSYVSCIGGCVLYHREAPIELWHLEQNAALLISSDQPHQTEGSCYCPKLAEFCLCCHRKVGSKVLLAPIDSFLWHFLSPKSPLLSCTEGSPSLSWHHLTKSLCFLIHESNLVFISLTYLSVS